MSTARAIPPAQLSDAGISLLNAAQQADITKLALVAITVVVGALVVVVKMVVGLMQSSREEMSAARSAMVATQKTMNDHHLKLMETQGDIAASIRGSGKDFSDAIDRQSERFAEALGQQLHLMADKIAQTNQGVRDMIEQISAANRVNTAANKLTAEMVQTFGTVITEIRDGHDAITRRIEASEKANTTLATEQRELLAAVNGLSESFRSFSDDMKSVLHRQGENSKNKAAQSAAMQAAIERMAARIETFIEMVEKESKPDETQFPVVGDGAVGTADAEPADGDGAGGAGGDRDADRGGKRVGPDLRHGDPLAGRGAPDQPRP
ncbi:MAG: hypothetical protein MUF38_06455 [Anaerolineae bacterium]|nr:hypothetical protein [Anaerolineae bacterium]